MSTFDMLVFIGVVGLVSGVAPTLLSIFAALLGGSAGKGSSYGKIWGNSISFFAGFIATVTVIGTAFWVMLSRLTDQQAQFIAVVVAAIAIIAAVIEIKDYFWYGRGISHKPHKRLHTAIHTRTAKKITLFSSFALGIIAVGATASNIGLVTITIASLLAVSGIAPSPDWFIMFSACLLIGLLFVATAFTSGTKISAILNWKEESKAVMRLGSGLALLATAWLILLIISHTLRLGIPL